MQQSGEWVPIERAGVEGWHTGMTLATVPSDKTHIIVEHDAPPRRSSPRWYTESRRFLLENGLEPLNDLARSGKDASLHRLLFWDENIYQDHVCRQTHQCILFKGTNSPVLAVHEQADGQNGCA